jgi:hypothetical protein
MKFFPATLFSLVLASCLFGISFPVLDWTDPVCGVTAAASAARRTCSIRTGASPTWGKGIPVLNLAPIMAKEAEERHVYFHCFDGQWLHSSRTVR